MKPTEVESLVQELRRQRQALFDEASEAEASLQFIAEDRQSEREERAQEECSAHLFARLDLRGKHAIEAIDAALQRIADGTYGICSTCGGIIPIARLRALPATTLCVDCARAQEKPPPTKGGETEVMHKGSLPADMSLLTDRELGAALRTQVHDDGRIDMEDLRIVCRRGVVYLDGSVSSEAERHMLLKLITDVAGLQEVVDRLHVEGIAWPRGGRSKRSQNGGPPGFEPSATDDIVKSDEQGLTYIPPIAPPADEED